MYVYSSIIILNLKVHRKKNSGGNLLALNLTVEGNKITIVNVYGPNADTPCFFEKVLVIFLEFDIMIITCIIGRPEASDSYMLWF